MLDETLPHPPRLPFVGSLFHLDFDNPILSLVKLAREHGPMYRMKVLNSETLIVTSQEIVDELCDEARFGKYVHDALKSIRAATGDGLFTAHSYEPNWALAHRILMPAFGPLGVRGMFDRMMDIARQMFDRWERFGPSEEIDVADTMTRLTLDTLALCAFDFRFNSFYREQMHPFVDAMVGTLVEAGARGRRPGFVTTLMTGKRRQFERDIALMHDMADALVASRREQGIGTRGDLLDSMLTDNEGSGDRLSDENVRYQLVTFLIAGHETTSGLLSFTTYLLLENPSILEKARALVDDVLGTRELAIDDLPKLGYLEQILMESLRLWPTAPGFSVTPHQTTLLKGEYRVEPGDDILVLLPGLHRDPAVWGDDAELFRPERFEKSQAETLPRNSWKPFGNGSRACIGRGFAMQEAMLVLSMMLQQFDFEYAASGYQLKVCETLTMKPEGLKIRVRPRPARSDLARSGTSGATRSISQNRNASGEDRDQPTRPALFLHGGNSGTSQSFARSIAGRLAAEGWEASYGTLDQWQGKLPEAVPIIVVCSSYEGLPPDNARAFLQWAQNLQPGKLAGVRFALLGCGNTQWARTYQAVPKALEKALLAAGAERIVPRGEINATGDMMGAFDRWMEMLMPALEGLQSTGFVGKLDGDVRPAASETAFDQFVCISNEALTSPDLPRGQEKRHVVLRLPAGANYRPGDHLAVMPCQPDETVSRVIALIAARGGRNTDLLHEKLRTAVEIEQPASVQQIATLAKLCSDPAEGAEMLALAHGTRFQDEIVARRTSPVDLIERFVSCRIDARTLLDLLAPILPRRYSISSSCDAQPGVCSLTVSVVDVPDTNNGRRHLGAASNHLARLTPGKTVLGQVRPVQNNFVLPADPRTPVIMIGAGSGIAPFRGFMEQRAYDAARGAKVGEALLFFGCRKPEADWLYRDEFEQWQERGLVTLRTAFSRADAPDGGRYVQDLVRHDVAEIAALMAQGGHIYVCGDAARLVPAVEDALVAIASEVLSTSPAVARRWCIRHVASKGRYAVDAFA